MPREVTFCCYCREDLSVYQTLLSWPVGYCFHVGCHGKIKLHLPASIQAERAQIPVNGVDPKSVRDYLAGLELADMLEVEELRQTPMELKLRQIWSLMTSADLLEDSAAREAGVSEVRERWRRIRKALP